MIHKSDNREVDGSEKAPMVGTGAYEYDGHAVDEFLWKGDPKATWVQRVGLCIIALIFLGLFAGFVVLTIFDHDWLMKLIELIMATLSGIVGFRLLLNAFRHKQHRRVDR